MGVTHSAVNCRRPRDSNHCVANHCGYNHFDTDTRAAHDNGTNRCARLGQSQLSASQPSTSLPSTSQASTLQPGISQLATTQTTTPQTFTREATAPPSSAVSRTTVEPSGAHNVYRRRTPPATRKPQRRRGFAQLRRCAVPYRLRHEFPFKSRRCKFPSRRRRRDGATTKRIIPSFGETRRRLQRRR